MARELKFESPSFGRRLKGMLGVDFYRLFHTPLYYIFLAIAAIIPAMVSGFTSMPDQNGNVMEPLYQNAWQIIAAAEPLYVINTIADYPCVSNCSVYSQKLGKGRCLFQNTLLMSVIQGYSFSWH